MASRRSPSMGGRGACSDEPRTTSECSSVSDLSLRICDASLIEAESKGVARVEYGEGGVRGEVGSMGLGDTGSAKPGREGELSDQQYDKVARRKRS